MSKDVDLFLRYRARHDESIEQRHIEIAAAMREVPAPLGWAGAEIPGVPDCGEDLGAGYQIKLTMPGIDTYGSYIYRGETYRYRDESTYDDKLSISFKSSNKAINYRNILHSSFPSIVVSFTAYLATAFVSDYFMRYEDLHEDQMNILRDQNEVEINGRNNIFTLHPAQYWDAELCGKALGYGPDEVIRRLDGQVPLVRPLMDGVYTVFNDDPDLSFEEFCAFNERFKPVLGLA